MKRKAAGKPIEEAPEVDDRSNVIDLMEALRGSLKGGRRAVALSQGHSVAAAQGRLNATSS